MLPLALLAALAPTAPVPKSIIELVVNGSFEEGPDLERKWLPLNKGSDKIKGWTVTRGEIGYIGGLWQAGDGTRSLDLHGSHGYGGVKQTIKTEKGKRYMVTFQMACAPGGKPPEKSLWVAAAGGQKKFSFDAADKSNEKMGWETMVWEFTADADETELEFYTAEDSDPDHGPALDKVSVRRKD